MPRATVDLAGAEPERVEVRGHPDRRKDKPDDSVPSIKRKLSTVKTEARSYYQEKTKKDDKGNEREMTEEEFTKMEEFTSQTLKLERQLEIAERWSVVDNDDEPLSPQDRRDKRGNHHMPYDDDSNTHNGRLKYSMCRAILNVGWPREYPLQGIERETHDELVKERRSQDRSYSGTLIPMDLPINLRASMAYARRMGFDRDTLADMANARKQLAWVQQRALDTTAGAGSIPTIVDTTIIDLLRPRMVTANMGARLMTDMQGLFAIPRQTTASTFYMVTQGGSITASNQTIDQVPFVPHTGGAYTTYTRLFLEQTNQDTEQFVREDQSAQVARGVETAGLNGQGALGWPTGLLQNPQIGVFPLGTNGGVPTWTQLISMIAYLGYYNADVGNLSFVCDALIRGTMQLTLKVGGSTFPIYLWNTEAPEFPLAGHRCPVTNLLPQNITKGSASNLHAMIFGNWEDMIYAFWSGLDVIVDPYTAAASGAVNIVSLQDFDVNERHYQSFSNCIDIISSITAPIT